VQLALQVQMELTAQPVLKVQRDLQDLLVPRVQQALRVRTELTARLARKVQRDPWVQLVPPVRMELMARRAPKDPLGPKV
jgi:hypothetical protein